MPKITKGGVSDRTVHPDYIAPSGTAPAAALDRGVLDAGSSPPSPGPASEDEVPKARKTTGKRASR